MNPYNCEYLDLLVQMRCIADKEDNVDVKMVLTQAANAMERMARNIQRLKLER